MIKRKLKSLQYYFSKYLFEKYAIPKVQDEKISKQLLKKYLPKNPVMIDCGAHDGADSVELINVLNGTLHCFEPVGNLYVRLQKRTEKYIAVNTYKLALSDNSGTDTFYISEGESDASSSLLPPLAHLKDHPETVFKQKIIVQTKTLDDWADENEIDHVDLLWLDMQGFEMNMLQASHKILGTVKVIHTEVSTRETYKGVAQYDVYKKFLEKIGFIAVIEAIPKGWDMGNVLFVRI
jgi:FkbM family methyltransferase